MRRDARRRGSAYIAVLGTAMLVTVISMASIAAVRVRFRSGNLTSDTASADLLAQSMMQLAIDRISRDPMWRINHTHNNWTSPEPLGDGTACYMLFDETDADLADDPHEDVRIHARADVGSAVRIYSARFNPPEMPNLLQNPGIENGLDPWIGMYCDVSTTTTLPNGGLYCLHATNRATSWAGPGQYLPDVLVDGATYQLAISVRMNSGASSVYAGISYYALLSRSGYVTCDSVSTPGTWTQVKGYLTPDWSGALVSDPLLFVATDSGQTSMYVDDASLIRVDNQVLEMAPGSWRREILP